MSNRGTMVTRLGKLSAILVVGLSVLAPSAALAQEGEWTPPVMISTNTVSSWFSDVAVDGWGQPHVVWTSGRASEQGNMDLLMYSSLVDQDWLTPNDVILTAYGGYTIRPALAVDQTDGLHLTFRAKTTIYYARSSVFDASDASSWSPGQRISGAGSGAAYYSDVTVDEQGRIHVVWNESVPSTTEGQNGLWVASNKGVAFHDGHSWRSEETPRIRWFEVYAMIEGEEGVQWFGTNAGLYRFDGVTWENLAPPGQSSGWSVYFLMQDTDGRMWMGTDDGVTVYDREAEQEEDIWTVYGSEDGLPEEPIRALTIDFWGTVWAGGPGGLVAYDGQEWIDYSEVERQVVRPVTALVTDSQGNIWIGTESEVIRYDGTQWRAFDEPITGPGEKVSALVVDRQDAIWVGTTSGLSRFDGQSWVSFNIGESQESSSVISLAVGQDSTLWVGTADGVTRYAAGQWQPVELPAEFEGREVRAIAEDRQLNAMCPSCADVFYRRSSDGGETWSAPVNLSRSSSGSVKPQVHPGSDGYVYVTWEEGEDWYASQGYPIGVTLVRSPDSGKTWDEPIRFTSSHGVPQQITLGVEGSGQLTSVWRPATEEESPYYYQRSLDHGTTWTNPEPIPGVLAKQWAPFSLDSYDAAIDGAGTLHLLVLGHLPSAEEEQQQEEGEQQEEEKELELIHLSWNGSEWSSPTRIFASMDPPEWPRIDVGAGNRLYATWFTRDRRHIDDSEGGRYKVWVSSYQSQAARQTPPSLPTATPTPTDPDRTAPAPTPFPTLEPSSNSSGLPPGLRTESDDLGRLVVALSPVAFLLCIIFGLRLLHRR